MSITFKQIYEKYKDQFKFKIRAGELFLDQEVTRLYNLEDNTIINWTRPGELILTMALNVKNDDELFEFISEISKYKPSGILLNIGGSIKEIPKKVVNYCEEVGLTLITFPWEIYVQDIMQEITNLIFEENSIQNEIQDGLLNAIYHPEDKIKYEFLLEKNGFKQYKNFIVYIFETSHNNLPNDWYFYFERLLKAALKNIFIIKINSKIIIILCDAQENYDKICHKNVIEKFKEHFRDVRLTISEGIFVNSYFDISESYKKAELGFNYAKRKNLEIVTFNSLGRIGVLLASDYNIMINYYEKNLKKLYDYDEEHNTELALTLESLTINGGNILEVSKKLYLHRNTVSNRINKIKEILEIDVTDIENLFNLKMAFDIKNILL